ncbi:MAG: Imm70 family immunity protein [Bacillota bacterium]|nr:Imm70 family immunity protein [Bacillota bacterium]
MNVGFRYSGIWAEVGESDFLHAFFSTISFHLESNKWGSRYPYLLRKFYYDGLTSQEIPQALEELKDIRTKFSTMKSEEIIWDAEDLLKKPPISFLKGLQASILSECFITVGGKNLINRLIEIFEFCIRREISIKIQSEADLIK